MDLLLIATYVGLCIIVFKVFKIPLNKWTVPTAALGGVFLIGALLLLMNYNHPYAKYAKEVYATIPVVPVVKGPVVEVAVTPNQQVSAGDVLFRIDPEPYQFEVDRKRAQLDEASQGSEEEEEAWKTAVAQVESARAERDRAKNNYERYKAAEEAFSKQDIENRRQFYLSAEADLAAAEAHERELKLDVESGSGEEDSRVAQLRAELRQAEYDLAHTEVRAPSNGVVTQLAIREGMMAVPLPLAPLMTFIPDQQRLIAGSFWQNSMKLIEEGHEAEVVLDSMPGHVFTGRVLRLLPAISEGQIQGSGQLISAGVLSETGRAIAVIGLDENLDEYNLPRGVQGHAVVYSDQFTHVAVMRQVLLRMVGWLNYVYPIK